jgi:Lrp/AsnC family transcriptional regulator, regulator for asnA, asnC and gidA
MATLDELDRRIITGLQFEGRRSFTALAEELGISVSAVRYRVNKLEQSGILQVVGIADPLKIGFDVMALIGVRVTAGRTEAVVEEFSKLPETSYVAATAGSFDAFLEVVCRDTAHFRDLLKRIRSTEGLVSSEAFFITEIHKMAYGWGVGRREDFQTPPDEIAPDADSATGTA